jgi:hypothetical protein
MHTGLAVPTNLMATGTGVGSLNISWSSSCFIKGIIQFSLVLLNLNSSQNMPFEVHGIHNLYHRYEIQETTSCDIYQLHVQAVNGSISSKPSDSITTGFPSLPGISPLEKSLQHSVMRNADGEVMLSFSFDVSQRVICCV